jgi:hypothetical protein
MYRTRPSLPYDILHGIQFPANISNMFAYLSYFPPPPPVVPGPPPLHSWTCSSPSISSLSCLVPDDGFLPPSREYIPLIDNNQSSLIQNISINSSNSIKSSTLYDYFINLYEKQFVFVLILIIIFIILLFLIFILILFLCIHRQNRQRQLTTDNKNKKFYYRLIPRRQKCQTTADNNEHKLVRLRKTPPTSQVIRISTASGIHTNDNNETEEAV